MTPELERMFHDIRSRAGDVPGASGDLPSSDELLQRHLHSATVGMLLRALHEFLCIYPSWAACSRAFAAALVMPTVPRAFPSLDKILQLHLRSATVDVLCTLQVLWHTPVRNAEVTNIECDSSGVTFPVTSYGRGTG